jgi:hypothetical protein
MFGFSYLMCLVKGPGCEGKVRKPCLKTRVAIKSVCKKIVVVVVVVIPVYLSALSVIIY